MARGNMNDRKPMVLILAGPNGSGKSTITQYFNIVGSYTNADELVKERGISNEEAALLVDAWRYESILKREDFTFETVLSSGYKLDLIKKAKDEGYFVKCVFVLTVKSSINVKRVESRVAAGGHNVDKDKIVSRYRKSLQNITHLIELCDILHVYDNTDEPYRIIRKHKDEDLTIYTNDYWTEEDIIKLIQGTPTNR